jgi:hypothetical protein
MAVGWGLGAAQESFGKLRASSPEQLSAHSNVGHVSAREQAARFPKTLKSLVTFVRCSVSKAHCNMRMHKQGIR